MTARDTGDGLAEAGEVLHDRGSEPDEGWFILGADGYFDVDNATWCEFSADDAPWTTEWFEFFGTVPRILAARSSGVVTGEEAERLRGEVNDWRDTARSETEYIALRARAETAEAEVERLRKIITKSHVGVIQINGQTTHVIDADKLRAALEGGG